MKGLRIGGYLTRVLCGALAAALLAWLGVAGPAIAQASSGAARPAEETDALPPLHTSGHRIVDAFGRPVRLAAASWYGAESVDFVPGGLQARPLPDIVRQIRQLGFNSVRLQWSNQLVESNPIVPDYAVTANPWLRGRHAMDVFDTVVRDLTLQGIMVVLDNHNSSAEWCCGGSDGNMLWYNAQYPESSWIADWTAMAARYRDDPLVVAADLRNEPRSPATWGGPAATNWQAAAERGGDAVLSVNPRLLVMVEGIAYAGDLSGAQTLPVQLDVPGRLVYQAHDYSWYTGGYTTAQGWYAQVYPKWGYLVTGPNPQPFILGEFGTCNTSPSCVTDPTAGSQGFWFDTLTSFLGAHDVSWAYWPINGTQSTGQGRTWNAPESYGVLTTAWDGSASPTLTRRLQQIAPLPPAP